jgi:hypothetical protein
MRATWESSAVRKFVFQMAVGAVVGVVSAALFLRLGKPFLPLTDGIGMFAACMGMLYVILGLFVGFGAAAPGAGARFLNVEDAEELREQRSMLGFSAVSCCLAGLFLLILSVGPATASEAGSSALALAAGGCLIAAIVSGKLCVDRCDELMRQICAEASVLTLNLGLVLLSAWGALAHLGLVAWITPLGLLSGFSLFYLLVSFWVVGRRGMLKPR